MWDDISMNDKKVCKAIASTNSTSIQDIRANLNFESNIFNQYRRRLTERGIVYSREKGHIAFSLPLFKDFVEYVISEEEF